jgi:hypothetical protein
VLPGDHPRWCCLPRSGEGGRGSGDDRPHRTGKGISGGRAGRPVPLDVAGGERWDDLPRVRVGGWGDRRPRACHGFEVPVGRRHTVDLASAQVDCVRDFEGRVRACASRIYKERARARLLILANHFSKYVLQMESFPQRESCSWKVTENPRRASFQQLESCSWNVTVYPV